MYFSGMTIQFASDLHLEFKQNVEFLKLNPLKPVGEILILAGDIMLFAKMEDNKDFFDYVSDHFQSTFWIPGNHEYYYSDINERSGTFDEQIRSNVRLLNNTSIIHDNVQFVFSTLWSKISVRNLWQTESSVADFHVIRSAGRHFSTTQFNQLHSDSVRFIKAALLAERSEKTVVVTHHVPTFLNYPERFVDSELNGAFVTELTDLMELYQPDYWIYGHHHHYTPDFMIGNTHLLTNQMGYVQQNEHRGFKPDLVISI
jgi:predicted phosphohydrolase